MEETKSESVQRIEAEKGNWKIVQYEDSNMGTVECIVPRTLAELWIDVAASAQCWRERIERFRNVNVPISDTRQKATEARLAMERALDELLEYLA